MSYRDLEPIAQVLRSEATFTGALGVLIGVLGIMAVVFAALLLKSSPL